MPKKRSHGVLDTLRDELKCVADRCERWQCLQRNTHGYGTSVMYVWTLNGSYSSDWHFTATGDIILFIVTG